MDTSEPKEWSYKEKIGQHDNCPQCGYHGGCHITVFVGSQIGRRCLECGSTWPINVSLQAGKVVGMAIVSVADRVTYDFASASTREDGAIGVHLSMHREDGEVINVFLPDDEARRLLAALGRSVTVLNDPTT